MNNLRVAWLLPTAWFYWHPVLSHFAKRFPQAIVFTGLYPGFAKGYEDTFKVEVVGKSKFLSRSHETANYNRGFTVLSLKIIPRLLQYRPDVIFADSFRIWSLFALLLKPFCRWRVILSYEGSSPTVDYRNSPFRLSLRRFMVRLADAYMTNSQAGKSYLVDVLGAKEDLVLARPYEVPDARALLGNAIAQVDIPQFQRPTFLFVGHLVERKGLLLLLQACHKVRDQGIHDFTLLVVGDGEQRQEAEVFIQDQGLEEQVKLLGKLDYSHLGDYFQSVDALILPTLEDTWGMVVLEALLFGKPILCSKWAGSSELITDGENGYVFDPRDPEQLAQLMSSLIQHPDQIKAMSEKAKQTMSCYTPAAASNSLAELVESLCGT
ncbi:glycosyltransferase family 4 protein [Leptolyngbya sp. AN02str]|uniref:glycosyltransferase family 4 protein n=1 Tax=Leptolyngbya sp. AN02str TaxID=3423363 RepID=UPI003D31F178